MLLVSSLSALAAAEDSGVGDEVTLADSGERFVEARNSETVVRGRPWVPHKRVATISRGTRLAVRGEVESRDEAGCHGKVWYAVLPFGYVCSEHVRPTKDAPETGLALPVKSGNRLPRAYALVRNDGAPMYASVEDVENGIVARELTRGMSLVASHSVEIGGASYIQIESGGLVAKEDAGWMGQGSDWQGVNLDVQGPAGPIFAWVRTDGTPVYEAADRTAAKVGKLALRERVSLLAADAQVEHPLWWKIGDDRWVEADSLNEVHMISPPAGVLEDFRVASTGNDQWIDVDVGEQVVVAYRGETPVYATLVSSGRGSPTPLGNYPIWAKVASMDMANQDYEDKPYMVQGVPWVLLFQGHIALHGAYWHDRFGNRKSHGCVNLAPLDARWLFEWTGPSLPAGWTGYLPSDLDRSVVVHVRDSSRGPGATFTQERPVGPPDREAERRKSEAAAERRELLEAQTALDDLGAGEMGAGEVPRPAARPPRVLPPSEFAN
jgi:lipoprotein-anchoring transpeptidase ErfK/SrfK